MARSLRGGLIFETSAYILSGASTLTLTGTPTISLNSSGAITADLSAAVSSSNQVTIGTGSTGSGTLNLNNSSNNFAGGINITAAGSTSMRLNFNAANAGGNGGGAGLITISSTRAILSNVALSTTGGALLLTVNNNINLGANSASIGSTGQSSGTNTLTLEFAGKISGNGDIYIQNSSPTTTSSGGGGITMFSNSGNDYTGQTFINNTISAVLKLGVSNALPSTTALLFGRGGSSNVGALDLNGKNLTIASLATNTSGTVNGVTNTVGATLSTLTIDGNATTTYSSVIGIPANVTNLTGASNNIALTLASTNLGSLNLSGTNTYTGSTNVNGGTLVLGNATDTLANTGALNVGGGILSIGANSDTVGTVTLASGSITGSTGTLTGSSYDVRSGSISAKLGGTSVVLTKSTAGTVTLSGANTYTGQTVIATNGGTLALDNAGSTTPRLVNTTNITVNPSGTLLLTSSSGSSTDRINNAATVTLAGGTFRSRGTFGRCRGHHRDWRAHPDKQFSF